MKIRRSIKYKLYNNRRNKHLEQSIDISGIIWNHMVALQKRYYKLSGKYISKYRMQKHLSKLRRTDKYRYWEKVGSQAVQQLTERFDISYQEFFKYKKGKRSRKAGLPKFKKVKRYGSFTLKQSGWKYLGGNRIKIGKHNYKFSFSQPLLGDIKTVNIKRDNLGNYFVTFSVIENINIENEISTNKIGGFDFGLKWYLTHNDGSQEVNPQFFKQDTEKIRRLNRQLSKKVKGSNNQAKARKRLSQAYVDISNKRNDYQWKLAHDLCDQYDYLFFETLNISAMKKLWGKKISDLSHSSFMQKVEYVCIKRKKIFRKINQWSPTTKSCSACGTRQDLKLSQRILKCACGLVIDRDWNAAINITMEGASSIGIEEVRQFDDPETGKIAFFV